MAAAHTLTKLNLMQLPARGITAMAKAISRLDWGQVGWLTLALGFAIFCGLALPIFGILVAAIVFAGALSLTVLAARPVLIVWMMMILVFLIVGQLLFFAGISQAAWLPYLALLLIAVKYLMELFAPSVKTVKPAQTFSTLPVLLFLFVLVFFVSAYLNKSGLGSVGVAAKNYVFPWFLTLLVWHCIKTPEELRSIWRFMLWMVVVQVPFAIVQHFYYAKRNGASWDVVVGTFGGISNRGGASGAMAVFVAFGLLLAAALHRKKQLSIGAVVSVWVFGLATIALAEVKIFFLVLPVGLLLLFRREIVARPLASLLTGGLVAVLLSVVGFIYQQGYAEKVRAARTFSGLFEYATAAEKDPYFFNPITKETSRASAIRLWSKHNFLNDYRYYLGHGAAASRESATLGQGAAAKKYPFTLTTSSASSILWDGGLVALLIFATTLTVAGWGALRLAPQLASFESATVETMGVMLLIFVPLLFYNRDAIDGAFTQTMLAFWFGYYLLNRRFAAESSSRAGHGN